MCGLFGWSGKDPKKFNQYKFDMLGVFNVDRGKDSCGVAYDGEIYHGSNENANFKKFIQRFLIEPLKYPIVIGHTRQASVGNAVNKFNIHPFGFGDLNGDYEMYGAHNGTIHNSDDLAKEFGIDINTKYIDNNIEKVRSKIDSEVLLEILYKSKNYKVLSKYNGGAAIVWTNLNEPNKLYVFKGASKDYSASVKEEEERPLFYYKESPNSLYFSSLEEPLWIISEKTKQKSTKRHRHQKIVVDPEPSIGSFDDNTVYIITDGDIDNAEKIKVSRAKSQQRKTYTSTYNSAYGQYDDYYDDPRSTYGYWDDVKDYRTKHMSETLFDKKSYEKKVNTQLTVVKNEPPISLNIYDDTPVHNQNDYKGRVYFNKLRYWKNGHLITGIYTWVNGIGYYYLAEDIDTAYKVLEDLKGRLVVGNDFLSKSECSEIDVDLPEFKHLMPFSKTLNVKDIKNIHYFIAGVKIETLLDYKITIDAYNKWYQSEKKKNLKVSSKNFDYVQLSHISNHPIIDVRYDYISSDCKTIIHRGIPVKEEKIMPLGSEKIYNIKDGKIVSITESPFPKNMLFGDPDEKFKKLDDIYNYLIEKDLNLLKNNTEESDNDVIIIENKQLFIERFKEELENMYIIFDDFIQEYDDFVKSNDTDSEIRQIMNQARSMRKFTEVQLSKDNLK